MYNETMKEIIFVNKSLESIKSFSIGAKRDTGHQLDRVQRGLEPNNWKPMTSIGTGAQEIRIKESDGIYRVIYVAKFKEAIYVLHAFNKKTQKTNKRDIDVAKEAYKQVLEGRKDE